MHANRTPIALVSMLAAAALLAACEKKTTVTDTAPGTASTTTSTTTTAPTPAASDAMAATANTMEKAASATEQAMSKAGEAIGDAAITGKVKTALIADPDVKAMKIDVDTKDHVVSLNGSADSQAHADKAVTIAKGVEGVKSVENNLAVKP
ncbi:MAG TPA: BON domain-containing protein [Caldimonas sp.]|jgi:osmotically-inducible protein OsmY